MAQTATFDGQQKSAWKRIPKPDKGSPNSRHLSDSELLAFACRGDFFIVTEAGSAHRRKQWLRLPNTAGAELFHRRQVERQRLE